MEEPSRLTAAQMAAGCLFVGTAGGLILEHRRRKLEAVREEDARQAAIDALFHGDDLLDADDDLEPDRIDEDYLDILAELSRTAVESGNDRYFTDYAFEEACALDGPSSTDTMDRGEDR